MFSRTSSGIRNSDLFYRNQYLVIVEGQDDVSFWKNFFPKQVSGYECKFKPVGGSEIKKYIDEVYKGDAKFAVALDSDYRLFMKEIHSHSQIVETISYSIENLMIQPQTLSAIICVESRREEYEIKNIELWLEHFDQVMHDLMIADYLIQKEGLGKECLGKSCVRFLENSKNKIPVFNSKKIIDFIKSLNLVEEQFSLIKEELRDYKPSQHIRGHFFFGSSLCFVNHEINKLRPNKVKRSIANDDLFTMLILACKDSLSACPDFQNLHEKAVQVSQKVVELLSIG